MARASGLGLGLHNHFWEFLPLLDSHLVGSDFLISETDPRYVHFEIDLYWAHYAHHDPVQIISYIQDRVTQFHVKDMKLTPGAPGDSGPAMTFTDPGTGVIDFRRIFASKTASPRNTEYIIERDDAGQGALTTAKVGFDAAQEHPLLSFRPGPAVSSPPTRAIPVLIMANLYAIPRRVARHAEVGRTGFP